MNSNFIHFCAWFLVNDLYISCATSLYDDQILKGLESFFGMLLKLVAYKWFKFLNPSLPINV